MYRDLEREIAGRPGIGAGQTEHDVDIGGPGTDAFEGGKLGMNDVLGRMGQSVEVERAGLDRRGDPALSVAIFARDSPARPRSLSESLSNDAGVNGCAIASSRPQIAPALATESCWPTIMRESPLKPAARRRKGGSPASA